MILAMVTGAWGGCSRTDLETPDARPPLRSGDGAVGAPDGSPPDGADASVPAPLCIPVPPEGGPVRASISLPVALAVVDLMFLLDATGSMADEIDNVRSRLRSLVVPGVRESIPDAAFGLALFGEFPVEPHGPPDVQPYWLRTPITRDPLQVEAALERVPEWGNYDEPEAQVEALYQVATGRGLSPWIEPSLGCPGGGSGGACFRRDALPVVMLITDAPFHDGPPGVAPESSYELSPAPRAYPEAVAALRELGALVIGLGATDAGRLSPLPHLRVLARDTGAVADGEPMAFDIGGSGTAVGVEVVRAVEQLASGVPLDVFAEVEDEPGDAFDARERVVAVHAVSASPAGGAQAVLEDHFQGVRPGTEVTFEIEVTAEGVDPGGSTLHIPARVVFRASGGTRIGAQPVDIVIGAGGSC
ncbi:MAG: hypothetical protein ACOC97_02395 [Myxococcota bacterium]